MNITSNMFITKSNISQYTFMLLTINNVINHVINNSFKAVIMMKTREAPYPAKRIDLYYYVK